MDVVISAAVATIIASLISAVVALVVSRRNADAAEGRVRLEVAHAEQRLRQEFALESSLEKAIQALMSKGFALRSIGLIQFHIRGFEENELRQLLIRSGCICFKVIKGQEYWGLLNANEDQLKAKQTLEKDGMKFFDLDDEDAGEADPDAAP